MAQGIDLELLSRAFTEHAPEVRRFLRGQLNCADTAADITQETCLRLIAAENPKPVGSIRALLFKVARNLAIDHLRSRVRRSLFEEGLANLYAVAGQEPQPVDVISAQDELVKLREGIERLAGQERRIFEMCRVEGLAHKDIAARLGISVSTVEKHMAAALDFLRRHLERGESG
jgi:RNA polymerase sigma factor (sigma-70 family)